MMNEYANNCGLVYSYTVGTPKMWMMIRNGAAGMMLLLAFCLTGTYRTLADNHNKFDEIVIELKFPSSISEGTGNSDSSSLVKKRGR